MIKWVPKDDKLDRVFIEVRRINLFEPDIAVATSNGIVLGYFQHKPMEEWGIKENELEEWYIKQILV